MGNYSIKNLNFSYPEQESKVLSDLTLNIEDGEFIVLCGPSGSGKTTFLRQLKPMLSPHGIKSGSVFFEGEPLSKLSQRKESERIGFVLQSPENQIVTDKVWHELAFGLESLGYDTPTIRLRVAEMASFFGIQNWFYKDVNELSGGQKQILNLAAIMALQPSVLILDEPTSQLDPIAATNFLETVQKINRELGTTIIMTEHRLEEALPMADRMIVMDDGNIIADGKPKYVGQLLNAKNHGMSEAMPIPMRIYAGVENNLECPLTVREGRQWLDNFSKNNRMKDIDDVNREERDEHLVPSIEIKEAWFKYEKDLPDVVKGVSLKAYSGELLAVLGGNGTGKSTMLSLISGINRPYRGEIVLNGKQFHTIPESELYNGLLGVLPQNPQDLFVKKTVKLDLYEMLKGRDIPEQEQERRVKRISRICQLTSLLEQHPYDLSGGEQQRAALAKVLLLEPEILLLDEPTKGMDAEFKQIFATILNELLNKGITIIMVSHDVEFCAEYADYSALFFDGSIVSKRETRDFFSGNNFYTTAANRMSRHILPEAVTVKDVIKACGGEVGDEIDGNFFENNPLDEPEELEKEKEPLRKKPRNIKRKTIGFLSLVLLIMTMWYGYPLISNFTTTEVMGAGVSSLGSTERLWEYVVLILLMVTFGTVSFLALTQRDKKVPKEVIQVPHNKRNLSKRTLNLAAIILIVIPITIYIGVYYLGDRKYYFISLLIILEVMVPFIAAFEDRKVQARELVVIAVLCALGVTGRTAFFMLPQFKPVAAIVIISGIAFGGESGFLVGAMTMLISNILYGQGPWTPWQMFAMGIIGFWGGILFRKGVLRRNRMSMATFGGLAVFLIYGGLMNPAAVIMFQSNITWPMILASYISGLPFDLIHAFATFFFLLIIGEPMLEKLDRIKVKYGLLTS